MEQLTIFIGGLVAVVIGLFGFAVAVGLYLMLTGSRNGPSIPAGQTRMSNMNEGDFHSGPQGYSPNTAYPETFYGSGGHDEGDFNR